MPASIASVRRIAPEFAVVSDADVQAFLDDAATELSASAWGTLYDRAHALVAAHQMAVAHPQVARAAGPVASQTVGSVSQSFAVSSPGAMSGEWGATRFGVEYLRLRRMLGTGMRVL